MGVVANKTDVLKRSELSSEKESVVAAIEKESELEIMNMSTVTEDGVMDVKTKSCEILLQHRVDLKYKTKKVETIMNRLTVAVPEARDNKARPAFIPAAALKKRQEKERKLEEEEEEEMETFVPKKKTERQIELEMGDDYIVDLQKNYDLPEDQKYDVIPETWQGHNIADFVDPDIMQKLEALEKEEEEREQNGFYKLDGLEYDSDDMEIHEMAKRIRKKRKINKIESRLEDKGIGRSKLPRKNANQLEEKMVELGIGEHIKQGKGNYKSDETIHRGRSVARKRTRLNNGDAMDTNYNNEDGVATRSKSRNRSASHLRRAPRDKSGMRDDQAEKARKLMKKVQKPMTLSGQIADSDRRYTEKMPKHLFSGKRGKGKTDRR